MEENYMGALAPPTPETVRAALSRLPAGVPQLAAAVHLALPADEVPGIAVVAGARVLRYRGAIVRSVGDPATVAAQLALAGHRVGDRYLDLDEDPLRWCKLIRSGSRRILFGTDVLFGAPGIALETGVDDDAAYRALSAHLTGELGAPPAVLGTEAGSVLVDGAPASIVLRPAVAIAPRVASPCQTPLNELTAELQELLAATSATQVVLTTTGGVVRAEVLCDLAAGWEAIVPVVLTETSELIGVPDGEIGRSTPEPVPEGFAWRGCSLWEDAIAAEHRRSGITVLLRGGPGRNVPTLLG